jgi:hypothetical protein
MGDSLDATDPLQVCGPPALLAATQRDTGFAIGTYGMRAIPTAATFRALAGIGCDGAAALLDCRMALGSGEAHGSSRHEPRKLLRDTKLEIPAGCTWADRLRGIFGAVEAVSLCGLDRGARNTGGQNGDRLLKPHLRAAKPLLPRR